MLPPRLSALAALPLDAGHQAGQAAEAERRGADRQLRRQASGQRRRRGRHSGQAAERAKPGAERARRQRVAEEQRPLRGLRARRRGGAVGACARGRGAGGGRWLRGGGRDVGQRARARAGAVQRGRPLWG